MSLSSPPKSPGARVGNLSRCWEAVDRFRRACDHHEAVEAAFLGGSLASGTADEQSDLDLYVVIREAAYEGFLGTHEDFLRSWGDLAFSTVIRDFEHLGFDMVLFVMADGVDGELATATERNFRATHGGPHRVLVDKMGLLKGVTFPELSFPLGAEEVQRTLWEFWWQLRGALKAWARQHWWEAASSLPGVRRSCLVLGEAAGVEDARTALRETFSPAGRGPLAEAIAASVRCYLEWGPAAATALRVEYPEALARVGRERVAATLGEDLLAAPQPT